MALIVDPDQLTDGATDNGSTEVFINVSTSTVKLNQTGNLSADGVTGKALYSFLKEEWKDDPQTKSLMAYAFPLLAITEEQFEWGNNGSVFSNWRLFNDALGRNLVRTAGWREYNSSGTTLREYAGIISLGTIGGTDQPYYENVAATPTDFNFAGQVNEAVQVFGNVDNGNFDRRSLFNIYVREEGKTFARSTLSDIGVTTMTYQVYRFPLANASDLKYAETDANIGANSPYTAIVIRYFGSDFTRDIDTATGRNARVVVDVGTHSGVDGSFSAAGTVLTSSEGGIDTTPGVYDGGTLTIWEGADEGQVFTIASVTATTVTISGGTFNSTESNISFSLQRATPVSATAEEIYEKVQYSLRQNSDIDATSGSVNGKTAPALLTFIGDTLRTLQQPAGGGVFIIGFDANDTNRIEQTDSTGTIRTFPFVAAGTIQPNVNAQNDAAARYWMYFQYTRRTTVSDLAVSGASGSTASIDSAGGNFPTLAQNDYIELSGMSNAANNGIWQVTDATPSATQFDATKVDGATVVNETAGSRTLDEHPLNSPGALVVNNNAGSPISGLISGSPSISFDFDYDGNTQGNRPIGPAGDVPVTVKIIGLSTAQYVQSNFTITRTTGLSFPVTSTLERNYSNPA